MNLDELNRQANAEHKSLYLEGGTTKRYFDRAARDGIQKWGQLIMAAPDLLAVLEALETRFDWTENPAGTPYSTDELHEQVLAAIRKAKGE